MNKEENILFQYQVTSKTQLGTRYYYFYAKTDIENYLKNKNIKYVRYSKDSAINKKEKRILELFKENQQLKEKLECSQTNEETYRLEMLDITKILGLKENELFDDVKKYANNLQKENVQLKQMANYQKGKFIDYLNGSILNYNVIANGIEDSDYKEEIMAKIRAFNEVLINYKEIIGDDK